MGWYTAGWGIGATFGGIGSIDPHSVGLVLNGKNNESTGMRYRDRKEKEQREKE